MLLAPVENKEVNQTRKRFDKTTWGKAMGLSDRKRREIGSSGKNLGFRS